MITRCESAIRHQIPTRREVVFLPYKAIGVVDENHIRVTGLEVIGVIAYDRHVRRVFVYLIMHLPDGPVRI